jgi:hypothetical protein
MPHGVILMLTSFLYSVTLTLLFMLTVIAAINRRTSHRLILITLSGLVLVYLTLVIVPFFAYGLHHESLTAVRGGSFDPKDYPLFNGDVGTWLHLLALLLLPLTPLVIVALGIRLVNHLRVNWSQLQKTVRISTLSMLLLSVALLAFMATPLGRTIYVWHFD